MQKQPYVITCPLTNLNFTKHQRHIYVIQLSDCNSNNYYQHREKVIYAMRKTSDFVNKFFITVRSFLLDYATKLYKICHPMVYSINMFWKIFFLDYWPSQQKPAIIDFGLPRNLQSKLGLGVPLFYTVTCWVLVVQKFTLFAQFSLLLCVVTWLRFTGQQGKGRSFL